MIINTLKCDFQKIDIAPVFRAVQGDSLSRAVALTLLDGGQPYTFPDPVAVVVRFGKRDGTGGIYDTLPDGTLCWTVQDNVLTAAMAPEVFTCPGKVCVQLEIRKASVCLCTFTFFYHVEADPSRGKNPSKDYYNWYEALKKAVEDYDLAGGDAVRNLTDRVTRLEQEMADTEVEVFAEQEISGFAADAYGGNCVTVSMEADIGLVVGETYKVSWNGEEYTCVCYGEVASEDGTLTLTGAFLGNAAVAFSVLPDTGEPFLIDSGSDGTYFRCAEGDSHTVAIYRVVEKPELPAIGTDDEGKILQVQNGEYVLAEMPGSEDASETVIFEEQDLAFGSTGTEGIYLWQTMPAPFALTEGETYRVEWNAEHHSCVAVGANFNGTDGIGIGNLALAGLGENTGEPFLIGSAADGSFVGCFTTETNETNKVAIYQTFAEATLPAVSSADNGKILQVVDGAWSAVAVADSAVKTYVDDYISSALEGDY